MKKIAAALLSLVAVSTSLLYPQVAKANRVIYCADLAEDETVTYSADHPHAYADGYREGEQSARNKEAYKPRTVGGEFARGFEDGYYNRRYAGQKQVVLNRDCYGGGYYTQYPYLVAPPLFYDYPRSYFYPSIDLNFGFGGFGRHRGWGHYGRW